MAKFYDAIPENMIEFIDKQHIFFTASAPLSGEGHVNLSPKGRDCLRVLSPNKVAYLDMTGSGNETSAHIKENGRITFMFCSFETAPMILRLYGTGKVILPSHPEWDEMIGDFTMLTGARQIIVADIHNVQTSCGYAVPFMEYVSERDTLEKWAENRGEEGLKTYHAEKNFTSMDGLPTPMCTD